MMKTYREAGNMMCPLCQGLLVPDGVGQYETLSEHCSDPNGTPSIKTIYRCEGKYCIAAKIKCGWLKDGEGPYTDGRDTGLGYVDLKQLAWNEGLYYPRGTYWYEYAAEVKKEKESEHQFEVGKYRLDIRTYHFHVAVWVKDEKFGTYSWKWGWTLSSFLHTLRHPISTFKWKRRAMPTRRRRTRMA